MLPEICGGGKLSDDVSCLIFISGDCCGISIGGISLAVAAAAVPCAPVGPATPCQDDDDDDDDDDIAGGGGAACGTAAAAAAADGNGLDWVNHNVAVAPVDDDGSSTGWDSWRSNWWGTGTPRRTDTDTGKDTDTQTDKRRQTDKH